MESEMNNNVIFMGREYKIRDIQNPVIQEIFTKIIQSRSKSDETTIDNWSDSYSDNWQDWNDRS